MTLDWIIDRFRRLMTVYAWVGSEWMPRELSGTEAHVSSLFPGFELPLPKLFAIADKYGSESRSRE